MVYQPIFKVTPYLMKLQEEATELRCWVASAALKVPWLPILQSEARVRATHSSTAIEGNPLTLAQVGAVARGEETGAKTKDKLEIVNYCKFRPIRPVIPMIPATPATEQNLV